MKDAFESGADFASVRNTMRTVIRVDSSCEIGSGHLYRCLTLADRWKKEGEEVLFISRDLPGNLSSLVEERGYVLYRLPAHPKDPSLTGYAAWLTVPQKTDAEETAKILRELAPVDRLAVDSYAISAEWETSLRPYVREIFVIDDLADRKHDCDVLLDQNFYLNKAERYQGLVPDGCRLLLGPEHALLRDEFYEAGKHIRKRDGAVRNILVFYGGIDKTDETGKAVLALSKVCDPAVSVNVIVGLSNPQKLKIQEACRRFGFHYFCQVNNMAQRMNEADLILCAGGTTTWEHLYLRVPAIVTAVAENQVKICEDCSKAGFFTYLGYCSSVSAEMIEGAVRDFMDKKKPKQAE